MRKSTTLRDPIKPSYQDNNTATHRNDSSLVTTQPSDAAEFAQTKLNTIFWKFPQDHATFQLSAVHRFNNEKYLIKLSKP